MKMDKIPEVASLLKRFKFLLFSQIKNNTFLYMVLTLLMLIGVVIGAFWIGVMPIETKDSLKAGIGDYFLVMPTFSFDNGFIFRKSVLNNILPIIILSVVSIKYLGIVLAPLYITFRGFCLGFSIAFLSESFGRKGLIYTLVAMMPQNLVYIPALVFAGFISINLSIMMLRLRKERFSDNRNKYILKYMTYASIIISILLIASFIEAYITPVFIKGVSPYL